MISIDNINEGINEMIMMTKNEIISSNNVILIINDVNDNDNGNY